MGILDKVAKLEKQIERLAERSGARRQPVEIRRAILEDIEEHVVPAGRSRRLLPYTSLSVVVGVEPALRAPLEALLEPSRLKEAIEEHLGQGGCEVERGLEVGVRFAKKLPAGAAPGRPFVVFYERRPAGSAAASAKPGAKPTEAVRHGAEAALLGAAGRRPEPGRRKPTGATRDVPSPDAPAVAPSISREQPQLVVLKGQATRKTFPVAGERMNIGRLAEVVDNSNRVVRRNQVVFLDADDEVTRTVSRAHAHIRELAPGEFRLHDDRSSHGTRIFRSGKTIEIPSGSPRGTKLQPGDEIYFGQAAVRFEFRKPAGS